MGHFVSNCAPERVFRVLSHMDDPTRRKMQHLSLTNGLSLRANSSLVMELAGELVQDIALSKGAEAPSARALDSRKRKRDDDGAVAVAKARMAALRTGPSRKHVPCQTTPRTQRRSSSTIALPGMPLALPLAAPRRPTAPPLRRSLRSVSLRSPLRSATSSGLWCCFRC